MTIQQISKLGALANKADAYPWPLIDQEDNQSDLGKIHEPSGHTVSAVYASAVASERYAACLWEDSDGDLRLTVYDRQADAEETLEVNGGDHSNGFIEAVGDDHFLVYCQDSANTQWMAYLYSYDPAGNPNKLVQEDSVALPSVEHGTHGLHAMTVLSDSVAIVSYISNGTGNEVSASQININLGAGTIALDGSNVARRLSQLDNVNRATLSKLNATQAIAYYDGSLAVVTVVSGTSIAIGAATSIHSVTSDYHNTTRPAVSRDGRVVAGVRVNDGATSDGGQLGAGLISGTTVSVDDALASTQEPNLLHEDSTSSPNPRSMGSNCVYLSSSGDNHYFAVTGNMPNPIKSDSGHTALGMIITIKADGTRFPLISYGGTFELPAKSSTHPVLARINENSFIGFYIDADDDLAATEISRFPY